MRFLESNEMLCLLPAEPRVTELALARLNPLFARHNGNPERLPALMKTGELTTFQINAEGKPAFVVWYRVELRRLIVDTVCGVAKHSIRDFCRVFDQGVEMLARSLGCNAIEGVTPFAGLARLYMAHGFKCEGILVRKALA